MIDQSERWGLDLRTDVIVLVDSSPGSKYQAMLVTRDMSAVADCSAPDNSLS